MGRVSPGTRHLVMISWLSIKRKLFSLSLAVFLLTGVLPVSGVTVSADIS
jgi:hypothetical protein